MNGGGGGAKLLIFKLTQAYNTEVNMLTSWIWWKLGAPVILWSLNVPLNYHFVTLQKNDSVLLTCMRSADFRKETQYAMHKFDINILSCLLSCWSTWIDFIFWSEYSPRFKNRIQMNFFSKSAKYKNSTYFSIHFINYQRDVIFKYQHLLAWAKISLHEYKVNVGEKVHEVCSTMYYTSLQTGQHTT